MFTLVPTLPTGNSDIDAAVAIVADFEAMSLLGKVEEACAKHMSRDFILVVAPGLPYSNSVYEGVQAILAFSREVQSLLIWGKPTVQVFGLTPDRCIMKVYDPESKLRETGEPWPFDVLEESWLRDGKIYKLKSYYFNQFPLIKSQILNKEPAEFFTFKKDEEALKGEQLKERGLHDAP